ncbi:hypothetical protein A2U01_0051536, partial [Trifolium medium]|nr:hypothetical protein [Trifolium medium]
QGSIRLELCCRSAVEFPKVGIFSLRFGFIKELCVVASMLAVTSLGSNQFCCCGFVESIINVVEELGWV